MRKSRSAQILPRAPILKTAWFIHNGIWNLWKTENNVFSFYRIGKRKDISTDCAYHRLVHPLTSRHPRSGSPVLSLLSKSCIFIAEELHNVSIASDTTFSFIKQTKEQIRCAECPRCYRPNWEQTSSGVCAVTLPLSCLSCTQRTGNLFYNTRNKNTIKHSS